MTYRRNTRWERLHDQIGWEQSYPELRTFVLYVISKMSRADHQRALLDFYFSEDESTEGRDARFYQFLREGRSTIAAAKNIMDWNSPEYNDFKYRNEGSVIDEILRGAEV